MPPVFIGMSISQLEEIARDPSITRLQKVEANDQSTERNVRDTTDVSMAARGPVRRQQLFNLMLYSREVMNRFVTKADWVDH